MIVFVSSAALATNARAASDSVATALRTWASVMEMFRTDDGTYPEMTSIAVLAETAKARGYWAESSVVDAQGRAYLVRSERGSYKISSRSGESIDGAIEFVPARQAESKSVGSGVLPLPHPMETPRGNAPDSPGTTLSVNKSGNDVVLSWTGTGTTFAGARAMDGAFTSAVTLFTGSGAASFTYLGGVANSRLIEFFDVTDETEDNRGGNWNAGSLPPPPPLIDTTNPSTNIGSLFVGSPGTIAGSGFAAVPESNTVCFAGGVCTQATAVTPSQIQFVTPPGALTGGITVTVGNQTSESKAGAVTLEDPASGWLVRTIGFSRQDKSYWMAGTAAANSVYRVYFDGPTGKWLKEDRGGAFSGNLTYCSTKTGRTGRVYCGLGTISTGAGGTRVAESNPPGNLQTCINFASGGSNNNVRGAAADPNPSSAAGRDVVYFAHANDGTSNYSIRQVAADCSSVLVSNYGNTNWFNSWNTIVGMSVDPVNGDLYVAAKTDIYKIAPNQSVVLVKAGFTSINGIDVYRQGTSDPGVLLIADGGVSNTVKALALDNVGATPMTVATASILRASAFGALVSGGPWLASNVNRVVVVHNNGNSGAVNPVRPDPFVEVTPVGPFKIRISSPQEQRPDGQSIMRPPIFHDASFSTAFTELRYRDGLSRFTCAWVGDPGAGVPQYDSTPGIPANCNTPRTFAAGNCDNRADITSGGPGSFVESGNPIQSCKTCGGIGSQCRWEFRITNRYGGDNYKVYFAFDQSTLEFAATSDVYTAWKHVHIERERMCNVGAVLFQSYGATGQCGTPGFPPCCGTAGQPACTQILVYDSSNISVGQSIVVFDANSAYETAGYSRTVVAPLTNNGNGSITLNLDGALPRSYRASEVDPVATPPVPDFRNGNAGGVCVPSGGFVEADLSDLRQGFDDAVVDFHIPVYGIDGAGAVPRLWPGFFDLANRGCAARRFAGSWYSRFVNGGAITGCPDPPASASVENNVFQVIPAFDTVDPNAPSGYSQFESSFSYVYDDQIAQDCGGTTGGCTATKQGRMNRWTCAHELAHQYQVNSCSMLAHFHDPRHAWCGELSGSCVGSGTVQDCPMVTSEPPSTGNLDMRADGIDHFCKEDLVLGDPNCGAQPSDGAIRSWEDPQ